MRLTLFALAFAGACFAQEWQMGGGVGAEIYPNASIYSGGEKAEAGFKTSAAFTVFGIQNMYEHVAGEIRYTFQFTDAKVTYQDVEAKFSAQTHAFSYAVLIFATRRDAAIRPYVVGGGGGKVYWGTGEEQAAAPPNAQFAILTQTSQIVGMATFGGGVSIRVGDRVRVVFDVRDDLTPFPKQVIAPVPGAREDGWLHSIVPTVSVSFGL